MTATEILLTTECPTTAYLLGYDGPLSVEYGGLKVAGEVSRDVGASVTLNGQDGEVSLSGTAEVRAVYKALGALLAKADRAGSQALAAAA